MNNFTTEIMETLINKGDLDDLFRHQSEELSTQLT